MMTSVSACKRLMSCKRSDPEQSGNLRSSVTRSTPCVSRTARAVRALSAVRMWKSCLRICVRAARGAASSSTIRTVGLEALVSGIRVEGIGYLYLYPRYRSMKSREHPKLVSLVCLVYLVDWDTADTKQTKSTSGLGFLL